MLFDINGHTGLFRKLCPLWHRCLRKLKLLPRNRMPQAIHIIGRIRKSIKKQRSFSIFAIRRTSNKKERKQKENIIWFSLPYSRNLSTNIGKKFSHLIDRHFQRSNKLHKIFTRNTIKVSYSCMDNMAKIIQNHNKKVTSKAAPKSPKCNCREKNTCPLNRNCQATSVIYQVKVKTATDPEKHI